MTKSTKAPRENVTTLTWLEGRGKQMRRFRRRFASAIEADSFALTQLVPAGIRFRARAKRHTDHSTAQVEVWNSMAFGTGETDSVVPAPSRYFAEWYVRSKPARYDSDTRATAREVAQRMANGYHQTTFVYERVGIIDVTPYGSPPGLLWDYETIHVEDVDPR